MQRRQPDHFSMAVTGDIGSGSIAARTLQRVAADRPDLFLALGDFSYSGPGVEADWCRFLRRHLGDVPVVIAAGNHEDDFGEDGSIEEYLPLLASPLHVTGEYGKEYWFDVDRLIRVIVIAPGLTMQGRHYYYGHDNQNIRWLAEVIDDARRQGVRWVVVCSHKNSISMGSYYCEIYQDLFSLLIEMRVDLVLHGHDHTYQRTKQLAAPCEGCPEVTVDEYNPACVADDGTRGWYSRGNGTVFVTSAAAGAGLWDIDQDDPEAGYFVTWMGSNVQPTNGYVRLDASPTRLEVQFVPSSDGPFRDRFEIRAGL